MNQGRIVKYSGCCGSTHAKVFEIILIIGFSSAIVLLTINLVLTMWFFKFAYSIFYIQIGLIALNLFISSSNKSLISIKSEFFFFI